VPAGHDKFPETLARQMLGDLAVAHPQARRNPSQCLPHSPLERRAPHIQRQIETERRRFDEADDFRDELVEVGITSDESGRETS